MEALPGLGNLVLQVLVVVLQFQRAEAVLFMQRVQGDAAEKGAVDGFDLVVLTDGARHVGLLLSSEF
jgi:hypothetical protein